MRNTLGAFKYQLKYFRAFSAIWLLVVMANVAITSLVMLLIVNAPGRESDIVVGQIDAQTCVFAFILGLLSFRTSFRFMLANGMSRKHFYWANLGALAAAMACWTMAVLVLAAGFKSYAPYKMLYELMYKGAGAAAGICWLFAGFFFLAALGWCINMLYYRCGQLGKILLSILPIVFLVLAAFIDSRLGWTISRALARFAAEAMGLAPAAPDPYRGAGSMLLLAALLCACNYLLVRKVESKDS